MSVVQLIIVVGVWVADTDSKVAFPVRRVISPASESKHEELSLIGEHPTAVITSFGCPHTLS